MQDQIDRLVVIRQLQHDKVMKIENDLNHPFKCDLMDHLLCIRDIVEIICHYLPSWCFIHQDYYRGTHCLSCLQNEIKHFTSTKISSWILRGPTKIMRREYFGFQKYFLVPTHEEDIQLFIEWIKYETAKDYSKYVPYLHFALPFYDICGVDLTWYWTRTSFDMGQELTCVLWRSVKEKISGTEEKTSSYCGILVEPVPPVNGV